MLFKKFCCLFLIIFVCSLNQASSQSLGIIYEASSFNLRDFYYNDYSNPTGLIKNLFFNYNAKLNESLMLSFRAGYGWNRYEFSYYDGKDLHERNTYGIPLEAEIKYNHFVGIDSIFAPLIGIGLGYYYYESKNKLTSLTLEHNILDYKFTSRGFAQYITFGMNINISGSITSSV